MCGFAGLIDRSRVAGSEELERQAAAMAAPLRARGPDDAGVHADARHGFGLAFRRLSIIDRSEAGHQPMESSGGRYVLALNGEIYDAPALKARLEAEGAAPRWRGHSDTEVLLAAIAAWGLRDTLRRSDGMFALALFDRERGTLALARDRFGEKPLVYAESAGHFLFGSTLAALRVHPDFDATVDGVAMRMYLRYGWIPAPHTIHRGARKLPAGSMLEIDARSPGPAPTPTSWWSIAQSIEAGRSDPFRGSLDDAADAVGAALTASVHARTVADVPVGALLSGGIDSSAIVAALPPSRDVRTFTIGFPGSEHDESNFAREVAACLGLSSTLLNVGPDDALRGATSMASVYDEPFADSSQIPTAIVCALARREVAVVLAGDGGDELFGGYAYYRRVERPVWRARQIVADLRRTWSGDGPAATRSWATRAARNIHSVWRDPGSILANDLGGEPACDVPREVRGMTFVRRTMYWDQAHYLADDLLVKMDRAAMAVGLEARSPFLARDVVDLAWRMPVRHLIGKDAGKLVLRRLLARKLPAGLAERPKRGFTVPVDEWLGGPLKTWTDELLSFESLASSGLWKAARIRAMWEAHRDGRAREGRRLWPVLQFEAWRRRTS